MEDMKREIEYLRAKSLHGIDRNKSVRTRNYQKINSAGTMGYTQGNGDLDTAAAFLMLRVCVSIVILAAFFASDIFLQSESITVFQNATKQMTTNISINDVVDFFKSLSWDTLLDLFK